MMRFAEAFRFALRFRTCHFVRSWRPDLMKWYRWNLLLSLRSPGRKKCCLLIRSDSRRSGPMWTVLLPAFGRWLSSWDCCSDPTTARCFPASRSLRSSCSRSVLPGTNWPAGEAKRATVFS